MPMPRNRSRKGGARTGAKGPRAPVPDPEPRPARAAEPPPLPAPETNTASGVLPEPQPARRQYVYGIIRAAEDMRFGPLGLGTPPAEVSTVRHEGLAAVVSDGPDGVPDPTRENLLAHERVNEAVMREHTVLPLAFGTLLRSREAVEALLRAGRAAFEAALARVEGTFELGLKVFYMARDGEVVRARAERDATTIVDALRAVAVDFRVSPPIGESMVLNAAFLVARERVAAFDARVRTLAARHEELTFRSTGPWPPYHFVDIRLGLEAPAG